MDVNFQQGYEYFRKHADTFVGAVDGADFGLERVSYFNEIQSEIDKLEKSINGFLGDNTPVKQLKGDVAEFFIGHTFNVNAALNHSESRVDIIRSNKLASPDMVGIAGDVKGMKYGLKFYSTGEESAKQQAMSVFERFVKYKAHGGIDDLETYLTKHNYTEIDAILNNPIYSGQIRIIPADQLESATQWLKRMIATESARRPELVERYRDTLKLLETKIRDSHGSESIALTKAEAEKLALTAKEGRFKAADYGLSAPDIINIDLLIKEAYKAGVTAAVISLVLKVGPEIYKTIEYLLKNGEIEEEQFKKIGFAAVSGTAEGFIRGSIAASITYTCKSGLLGALMENIEPSVVGAVVVLTMNVIKGSYAVAIGKKTRTEVANEIVKDTFISACALIGGGISQMLIKLPVFGYLMGSFVGSITGSFTYDYGYKKALSFCIDTGFTLFGLVEQDYTLPDDMIKQMGIETFNYETFKVEEFKPDTFEVNSFTFDTFEPDNLKLTFLRRGVIGISKIEYV